MRKKQERRSIVMPAGHSILIAGAGAIGSVIGGYLRMAGHDVTLLSLAHQHLDTIDKHGLRIDGLWGKHHVKGLKTARRPEDLRGEFNYIIVCTKSYDTLEAARSIRKFTGRDSVVGSFQNGLGNMENIAGAVGGERTCGARVIFGAVIHKPGTVTVTVYADKVMVGPFGQGRLVPKIRTLAELIDRSGIPAEFTEEVRVHLWGKILYNCPLNPLSALLGVNYGELAGNEASRGLMDAVMDEIFNVAAAMKQKLLWKSADDYRKVFYGKLIPPTALHRASMLEDIENNRRTEIDAMNGMIVKYGSGAGVKTPVNETLTRLIRFREGLAGLPDCSVPPRP